MPANRLVTAFLGASCLLAAALGAHSAEPGNDQALLDRIVAVQAKAVSMKAVFAQRTTNTTAPDDPPRVMRGHFELVPPDRYNLVLTSPGDADWRQRFVCDGRLSAEIEQVVPDLEPTLVVRPAAEGDAGIRRIISCARGDLTELGKDFSIRATAREQGGALVVLSPATADVAKEVDRVRIELGKDLRVTALTLDQPGGARIAVTIESAEYDAAIAPETFAIPAK